MQKIKKHLQGFLINFSTAGELLSFLWSQKLWWSIPLILILLFLMVLVIFGQGTGLAPFIYPLF